MSTRDGAPNLFPFLRYQDAAAAIDWLGAAFGFEPMLVIPGPDGTVGHAELRLGPGVIMVGSAKEDALGMGSPRDLGAVTQGVYVYVADLDAHHARAAAASAEMVYCLRDTDYGSREYGARDPEGHLWTFGTYYPGADGGASA